MYEFDYTIKQQWRKENMENKKTLVLKDEKISMWKKFGFTTKEDEGKSLGTGEVLFDHKAYNVPMRWIWGSSVVGWSILLMVVIS